MYGSNTSLTAAKVRITKGECKELDTALSSMHCSFCYKEQYIQNIYQSTKK